MYGSVFSEMQKIIITHGVVWGLNKLTLYLALNLINSWDIAKCSISVSYRFI